MFILAKNHYDQVGLHRLNFNCGEAVIIKSVSENWFYGHKNDDPHLLGIFPKSYVAVIEGQKTVEDGIVVYKAKRSPINEEITTVLNEWKRYFIKSYLVSFRT